MYTKEELEKLEARADELTNQISPLYDELSRIRVKLYRCRGYMRKTGRIIPDHRIYPNTPEGKKEYNRIKQRESRARRRYKFNMSKELIKVAGGKDEN